MSRHEQLVYQEVEPCPYLEDRLACMPLRWQLRSPTPEEFYQSLSEGDRRIGRMLYRTQCPSCNACEPIRIPVNEFKPTKSQRKVWKKNQDLTVRISQAVFTEQRLEMYNRHKIERGLSKTERPMSKQSYENWFLTSCADTREFQYFIDGKLVCVSIVDFGRVDISSVYVFFDPDYSLRSLGTFSALFEVNWMRERGLRYYYLGLYVGDCAHLNYKAKFYPNERRIDDQWYRFANSSVSIDNAIRLFG